MRIKRTVVAFMAACGDSATGETGDTTAPPVTSGATSTTGATSTALPTSSEPASTTTSTSSPTTSSTPTTGTTAPVDPTTTQALTDAEGTDSCTCTPGEQVGCVDITTASECAADCVGHVDTPCPSGQACLGDACIDVACIPGETQCADDSSTHTCQLDGGGFDASTPCPVGEGCFDGVCTALCVLAELSPRSTGCSFFAHTMDNYYPVDNDSVIVGNTHPTLPAAVQLYLQTDGAEQPVGAAKLVAPGAVEEFLLTEDEIESASELRPNGAYRISSDIPIVAYQHAPRGAQLTNDASMLLPEPALARNYVIASAREGTLHKNHASYFVVIAAEDDTTVTWNPPVATLAGTGVPGVLAGGQGKVTLDRLATLQVSAAFTVDLTGTYVSADKPIWVMGASACVSEPVGSYTCDHIEEQMLPIDYWGQTYVAAHAPKRGNEKYRWRVFGGEDGVEITTTPDQTGGPFTLMKGEYKVITATDHFVMTGTGAFMPVQYLESQTAGAGTGDPSIVQMIPVEQFLDRYVFATGVGYTKTYVQVIRKVGGADVTVDGDLVGNYVKIGDYELSDVTIAEGSHLAESAGPFAIINIGYTDFTSYAYPGGMKLDVITPQ